MDFLIKNTTSRLHLWGVPTHLMITKRLIKFFNKKWWAMIELVSCLQVKSLKWKYLHWQQRFCWLEVLGSRETLKIVGTVRKYFHTCSHHFGCSWEDHSNYCGCSLIHRRHLHFFHCFELIYHQNQQGGLACHVQHQSSAKRNAHLNWGKNEATATSDNCLLNCQPW